MARISNMSDEIISHDLDFPCTHDCGRATSGLSVGDGTACARTLRSVRARIFRIRTIFCSCHSVEGAGGKASRDLETCWTGDLQA